MEFSKKLVLGIFIVWVASLMASSFVPNINYILEYTNNAMISGVVGYILKAGAENVPKVMKTFGNQNNDNMG